MRLSTRLVLALLLLVSCSAALSVAAARRVVLAPLSEAVFDAYVDQAVYVAERVEGGEDPGEVGRRMGLQVTRDDRPPPPPPRGRYPGRKGTLRTLDRSGHHIRYLPGPRDHLHIKIPHGWLHVQRSVDLGLPLDRLALWLLGVVLLIGAVGAWMVRSTLRPLDHATQAMLRVAEGDLDHRLPSEGPPEVRQVAAAFHRMTSRLKVLLAADRQLVAGVSHELRTPLTRLRLRMELLRDELGASERLDQMDDDIAALDHLVGELLHLSRLQIGNVPIDRQPWALDALLRDAVADSDVDPARLVWGTGAPTLALDRELLLRALGNLLQNIHRYAPDGPVEVSFTDHSLTLADRGPGVPEGQLSTLPAPFVRADESRAAHTGGLGLGLMIVQQVQELHGGSFTLANRPGGGLAATLSWT